MPYEYARDDKLQRMTVTTSGFLTLAEMMSIVERQAAEGTWSYSVLYVPREVTNYPKTDEMRALVSRVKTLGSKLGPRRRIAIVDPRPTGFGMWRMYGSLAEGIGLTVNVFRRLEEAEAWLQNRRVSV